MSPRAHWPALAAWAQALVLAVFLLAAHGPRASTLEHEHAELLTASDAAPPGRDRAWQSVRLPDIWRHARPAETPRASWYRIDFRYRVQAAGEPWAVYFPYLYDGAQVWLNGSLVAQIPQNTARLHVRWTRPHLVHLPVALLKPGSNELLVRAGQPPAGASMHFPRVSTGAQLELGRLHDRRYFWVHTTPEITATVSLLASLFVLYIWSRRRSEVQYGLFGLAAGLWGIRTLTFVVEVVPMERWPLWRLIYLGATGGFIVVMTLLALREAGIRRPWIERALAAYWLAGPLWLLAQGPGAEPLVNRYWIAGFLPIGTSIMLVSLWSVWRQRTLGSAVLPTAMVIAVLAGIHDYLIAWNLDGVVPLWPAWAHHRIYLLHHGANLVMLAMGGLLAARFIRALTAMQEMNQTLESRIAQREQQLSDNYERMAALEREHAAGQERQRIMRDLHDGLGSQLLVSLSRVERGDMAAPQVADALRACIADMRLALDTLAPEQQDFRATLGDFLFRWRGQLLACGIELTWAIEVPDEILNVSPDAALQLLRVAQEALTNVVKHAHARQVHVRLHQAGDLLELEVIDDGRGQVVQCAVTGRGMGNMRSRAARLGGHLDVDSSNAGTRIALRVPVKTVLA